jgi:cytochrome P450
MSAGYGPGMDDPAALHIDPEHVGLFTRDDYYDLLARLRREAPVFRYAPHSWTVATYAGVREVSRDPQRFRSGGGVLMNDPVRAGAELPGSILHMDPPTHAAWRKVGSRWFTPRAAAQLEEQIRSETVAVLDAVAPGQEIDLVAEVAAPIPVLVIAELLGVGDAERTDLRRWSDACIEGSDEDDPAAAEQTMVAVGELLGFLTEHTVARRDDPRQDLLSELVTAVVDGRTLEDHEVVMYCMSLLVAGNETTRHLISGSVAALSEHPDQVRSLAGADDATLSVAVEECLRWVTPIQAFARTATVDTQLGGQVIEASDWVVMLYAGANRDEAAFGEDADRFDTARPPQPAHQAFGFGEHLCLGASLARLEARIFLDEYLARFPGTCVSGEPTWTRSTLVRGYSTLPVTLA